MGDGIARESSQKFADRDGGQSVPTEDQVWSRFSDRIRSSQGTASVLRTAFRVVLVSSRYETV